MKTLSSLSSTVVVSKLFAVLRGKDHRSAKKTLANLHKMGHILASTREEVATLLEKSREIQRLDRQSEHLVKKEKMIKRKISEAKSLEEDLKLHLNVRAILAKQSHWSHCLNRILSLYESIYETIYLTEET